MVRLLLIASFLLVLLPTATAQRGQTQLLIMSALPGELTETAPEHTWQYGPYDFETSVFVRTLNGSLDPALELLDESGTIIAENSDINAEFGTAARLTVPAGGPYQVRVRAAFGAGTYEIISVPGDMQLQWRQTFERPRTDWNFSGAPIVNNAIELTASRGTRRVIVPDSAPAAPDVYVQARIRLLQSPGDAVEGGLAVRSKRESNGQYTAYHFVVAPQNRWVLQKTDITGAVTPLKDGVINTTSALTLGLLAQGSSIRFFLNGESLGEIRDGELVTHDGWGISLLSGSAALEEIWFATPPLDIPQFPRTLETWNSVQPNDIVNEVIGNTLFPAGGKRRIYVATDSYRVNRREQRAFIMGQPADVYAATMIGLDVRLPEGVDTGCGIVARYTDDTNQIFAYVDLQGGAGLLWWEDGTLKINDYSMIENRTDGDIKMVLVAYDQYVSLYVNGVLTAQDFIPNRVGDVGVGFINYADQDATCVFRNFWVWS
jgi:hypothetical protein